MTSFRALRFFSHSLCWLLSFVMVASQPMWALASQPAVETLGGPTVIALKTDAAKAATEGKAFDLTYCTKRTVAAIYLHPRDFMQAPANEMLPLEVFSAAGKQYLGIDPLDIDEAQCFIETPAGGMPSLVIVLKLRKPFTLSQLPKDAIGGTTPGELNGKPVLKKDPRHGPSLYMPNDRTLMIGTLPMIENLSRGKVIEPAKYNPLQKHLAARKMNGEVYAFVDLETLRPMLQMGLSQVPIPPEFKKYTKAADYLRGLELELGSTKSGTIRAALLANNADDAQKILDLVNDASKLWLKRIEEQTQPLIESDDPIQKASAQWTRRIMKRLTEMYVTKLKGDQVILFENNSDSNFPVASAATIGILVALLLPAVQAAREAARRNSSRNRMKQFGLSMIMYESVHKHFPAQANYDKKGKALLSWRVHILPYLEEQELYDQFHLDEPWNSRHNIKLLDKMPAVFNNLNSRDKTKTQYLVPYGKGLFFSGKKGRKLMDFEDGLSNTIMLMEVDESRAVPWTKPVDYNFNPKQPLDGLGHVRTGVFIATFCDGHVAEISKDIDLKVFKAMLTIAGGEVLNGF